MINARQITKFVVSTIVTIGVNKIISDVIKNNVSVEEYLEPEELELTEEEEELFTEEDITAIKKRQNTIRKVTNVSHKFTNFALGAAGFAVSSFIGKAVGDYVENSVDDVFDAAGKLFTKKA